MYQLVLCIFTYCLEIYLCWYSTNSFIFNYLTVSTFLFTNYWCYRNKHSCIFLFIHSERISLGCITKNRIALIRHGHFFLISLAITHNLWTNLDTFFKKGYLFLERGEGREKERERNINVWLPCACPLPGTWPTTQACALTGNRTGNPLLCRPALSPLSLTSQGNLLFFFNSASLLSHPWWGSPTPTIDDLTSSWSNLISILVKMLFSSSVSLSVALEPHF